MDQNLVDFPTQQPCFAVLMCALGCYSWVVIICHGDTSKGQPITVCHYSYAVLVCK